jgi:hypothetical protein
MAEALAVRRIAVTTLEGGTVLSTRATDAPRAG